MERRRCGWFSLTCFSLLSLAGCGSQPAASSGGAGAEAPPTKAIAATKAGQDSSANGPAATVRQFLEAVRTGNDVAALQWLTPVARQKTQELHMSVAPPGTETSQFAVGEVEMVEGGAHVASTWSDLDGEGNRQSEAIVWLLAKEAEGWRIAGMATTLFEEKLPIVLNFEEPEEMLQKQQLAEAEAQRRAAQGAEAPASAPNQTSPAPESTAPPASQQDRMTESSPAGTAAPATASRNVLRKNSPR